MKMKNKHDLSYKSFKRTYITLISHQSLLSSDCIDSIKSKFIILSMGFNWVSTINFNRFILQFLGLFKETEICYFKHGRP